MAFYIGYVINCTLYLMCCLYNSLFQKYRLFELLFTTERDELQTSMEVRHRSVCVCVCVCSYI